MHRRSYVSFASREGAASLRRRTTVAVLAAVGTGLFAASAASAAELPATTSNLAGVFASAQPGDTVRLASGNYGTFNGGAKAGTVTLAPQAGATATLYPNLNGANNLRFDGLTVDGATVVASRNITFVNSAFTGMTLVKPSAANANIVFDRDTFDGIDVCSTCYEGRITVNGTSAPRGPSGVVISNSHFSGGNADGVQLIGGIDGARVGPGNEFTTLAQSSVVHTDPIQLYGADNTVITGNYIHDTATGIMAPDGSDGPVTITNNVFARTEQPSIYLGHQPTPRVEHNTISGSMIINDDPAKSGPKTSGAIVKNNVITGGLALQNLASGALVQSSNNLTSGVRFVGGTKPSTLEGFRLVAGSAGTGAADDGTDIGAFGFTVGGGATTPPGVTPPTGGGGSGSGAGNGGSAGGGSGSGGNTGGGNGTANTPPSVSLQRPTAGGRFTTSLRFAATAQDDSGIARVELWFDGKRLKSDSKAPYGAVWHVLRSTSNGTHTATARVVAKDGQIASQSVTVTKVRSGATTARSSAGWAVASSPRDGATVLTGTGRARHRVTVTLARCADRAAKRVVRRTIRASKQGRFTAKVGTARLCVSKLKAR